MTATGLFWKVSSRRRRILNEGEAQEREEILSEYRERHRVQLNHQDIIQIDSEMYDMDNNHGNQAVFTCSLHEAIE
jgi:hypothetical protein